MEGNSVRIVCVYDPQDGNRVRWSFNNGPLLNNVEVFRDSNYPHTILNIRVLRISNFGTYKCEVIDSEAGIRYYDTAVLKMVQNVGSTYGLDRHTAVRRDLSSKFGVCHEFKLHLLVLSQITESSFVK